MKRSKQLATLLTVWLIAIGLEFCVSCGHVTVYDKEVCGDLGNVGAHCAHTLTDAKRDIPKAQWDRERIGYLCAKAEGWNDTETSLDQLCTTTNLCDFETRETLGRVKSRMRPVAKKALAARRRSGIDTP